jgi:bifunctional DNA-binding transcriptional regulator/antitoxin component of YhaV-PrlF toxin-antitoxin module
MAYYLMKTIIQKDGGLIIPPAYLKVLGIKPGDEVLLYLEDGEIGIISTGQDVGRAQTLVRRYIPKDRSLSEELIKDRRGETAST